MTRGSRSGRVAWQFIQDLAGRMGGGSVSKSSLLAPDVSSPSIGAAANLKYWIDRLIPSANFKMKLGASNIARSPTFATTCPRSTF